MPFLGNRSLLPATCRLVVSERGSKLNFKAGLPDKDDVNRLFCASDKLILLRSYIQSARTIGHSWNVILFCYTCDDLISKVNLKNYTIILKLITCKSHGKSE